ncbi:MAG: enoyl-CoA hydratase/isomerase family protein, partial [Chloroflexi bacterium]|nr:enoyl-CoA hydratase/isomerase family protein [Chloroflexota bacterium]
GALNALDTAAKELLAAVWRDAAADPSVRALVLCGAGERAFCVGSDVKEMERSGEAVANELLFASLPGLLEPLDKPLIAAVRGYCLGLGLTMAIHCDMRLAAPDAVLGLPDVKGGMISGVGALRLMQVIPSAHAFDLLLLGRSISASEAERIGLVNRVVDGDVVEEAIRWAAIAASHPPAAVSATKRLATMRMRQLGERERAEVARLREELAALKGLRIATWPRQK